MSIHTKFLKKVFYRKSEGENRSLYLLILEFLTSGLLMRMSLITRDENTIHFGLASKKLFGFHKKVEFFGSDWI